MHAATLKALGASAALALATGLAAAQSPGKQFELRVQEVGSHVSGLVGRAPGLPLNRRYAELDLAEQALVRAQYDRMPEGDEPPYPAEGLLPLFMALQTGAGRQPPAGAMTLVADVDSTGQVRHVDAYGQLDTEFARFAARALAGMPFKPGVCAGRPCNMQYVVKLQFDKL